jgi:hypothetical protein
MMDQQSEHEVWAISSHLTQHANAFLIPVFVLLLNPGSFQYLYHPFCSFRSTTASLCRSCCLIFLYTRKEEERKNENHLQVNVEHKIKHIRSGIEESHSQSGREKCLPVRHLIAEKRDLMECMTCKLHEYTCSFPHNHAPQWHLIPFCHADDCGYVIREKRLTHRLVRYGITLLDHETFTGIVLFLLLCLHWLLIAVMKRSGVMKLLLMVLFVPE